MSALPPKADIPRRNLNVRFGPEAEVAVIRSVELIVQPNAHDVVGDVRVRSNRPGRRSKIGISVNHRKGCAGV